MMVFVMQTAYDQKNSYGISLIHDMVYVAKEEAKSEGSFTPAIQSRLRKNLSKALSLPPGEIVIACREEDSMIYYRVEVPIKDVIAGNGLFGIKDKDNSYMYVIDSCTVAKKAEEESEEDCEDEE